jgi:RNA polymerase sigma-70 factor (ECF subfamily)
MQAAATPVDSSTEAIIQARDLSAHVEQALTQLPQKCRQVYELSRKEYKSNREIAETLNISEKTVENQLTKALRVLRLNLKNIVAFFF